MTLLDCLLDLEKRPYVRRYDREGYDLDAFRAWVDALGAPDRGLAFLHIAGTKGKGSTAALAEAILRAHGLRTGLYTSPHLAHFGERFRIDGEAWTQAYFEAALERFEARMPETHRRALREGGAFKTVFEVLTALALTEFAAAGCEAVVWETGLGGRLDATNIVRPVTCAITRLGLDHTRILGPTIAHIAREKAGILKGGVPAVYMAPLPEHRADVIPEIEGAAARVGAPLHEADALVALLEAREASRGTAARYRLPDGGEIAVELPLHGLFQARNAQVALAAAHLFLEARGLRLDPARAAAALEGTRWPGRIEIVRAGSRPVLILDGAHCPSSARALGETLAAWRTLPQAPARPPYALLVGMNSDKDHAGFARNLVAALGPDAIGSLHGYRLGGERGAPAEVLAEVFAAESLRMTTHADWREALAAAGATGTPVVATGTLYTIDPIRRAWTEP